MQNLLYNMTKNESGIGLCANTPLNPTTASKAQQGSISGTGWNRGLNTREGAGATLTSDD